MIKVKICGIANQADALFASREGADALGFIFTPKSPRCITKTKAKRIIARLEPYLIKVGVFLDQDRNQVLRTARSLGLDVLQFHGNESPSYCRFFSPQFKVIKVLFPEDRPFKKKIKSYRVDGFLFDIKLKAKAKGPRALSDPILREISSVIASGARVIISAGLNPNNIGKIKRLKPYALDVASGVEARCGKKDKNKVRAFIRRVKK